MPGDDKRFLVGRHGIEQFEASCLDLSGSDGYIRHALSR
jgi:hypothetical protein